MKKIIAIDKLHRRRLAALESALKHARALQVDCEATLVVCRHAEVQTREAGVQLKRDIDAVLFNNAVKRPDIGKAQHQLVAAKDALADARKAVVTAEADMATALCRTEEATLAWRRQAAKVEKFDTVVQLKREESSAEMLYREEVELEDIPRRRA